MQKFDENELRMMSKGLNTNSISPIVETFKEDLTYLVNQILMAMNLPQVSGEPIEFGAYSRGDIISENEAVSLAIVIKDAEIYEQTNSIGKYKIKNKRSKKSKLEEFKILLVMMLQRYFNHKVNISLAGNAILVECIKIYNQNFKIFVFTQRFNDDNLLTISNSDYHSCIFNINQYTKNFDKKNKETSGNYSKICNVLKSIALDFGITNDTLLIETYLYNIPSELFVGYLNEQLFKILNEYMFKSKSSFSSMSTNLSLTQDKFINCGNYYKAEQTFNKLLQILR